MRLQCLSARRSNWRGATGQLSRVSCISTRTMSRLLDTQPHHKKLGHPKLSHVQQNRGVEARAPHSDDHEQCNFVNVNLLRGEQHLTNSRCICANIFWCLTIYTLCCMLDTALVAPKGLVIQNDALSTHFGWDSQAQES